MKDYKRRVFWLDYFNSTLSREQGRRIPVNKSVKDPTLDELVEAATRLGYKPESTVAKFPQRMMIPSGYVSLEKRNDLTKSQAISELAKTLSTVRGETSSALDKDRKGAPAKKH